MGSRQGLVFSKGWRQQKSQGRGVLNYIKGNFRFLLTATIIEKKLEPTPKTYKTKDSQIPKWTQARND